uniref:HNH nuclease domain-containing protein n=1 Tax=viral metagenome TaxID=1070528 RepID=A0A6C0JR87_9ZZZZ
MSVWRQLQEFQNYEISDDYVVRKIGTKELVPTKGGNVMFGKEKRSVTKLAELAFAFEDPDEEWTVMEDDFPTFSISTNKRVRNDETGAIVRENKKTGRVNLKAYDDEADEWKKSNPTTKVLFKKYITDNIKEDDPDADIQDESTKNNSQDESHQEETQDVVPDEEERWIKVKGYKGEVSNFARVKSLCRKTAIILTNLAKKGYLYVQLTPEETGKRKNFLVAYLVWTAFRPEQEIGEEDNISYIDGDKGNPRLNNLYIGTLSEVVKRAYANGRIPTNKRPIYQINMETGEILAEYPSATDAEKELGYNRPEISAACNHGTEYKGFYWKFVKKRLTYTEDLPGEIWAQFRETNYDISTRHRIKNRTTNFLLQTKVDDDDRTYINLTKKTKSYRVSRMVAEAFIPNPKNLKEVDHIDENPLNDNVENLRWINRQDNQIHSFGKSICQYDLDGNFIKCWETMTKASKGTNTRAAGMSHCANGIRDNYNKFIWRFTYMGANQDDDFEDF